MAHSNKDGCATVTRRRPMVQVARFDSAMRLYALENWPYWTVQQLIPKQLYTIAVQEVYKDCFTTYWKQHASDLLDFKLPMDVLQDESPQVILILQVDRHRI
eukprot:s216_g37.t1